MLLLQASTLAVETDQRPKVLMTNRTHEAASLSFDPFSPPGYSHGYVAQWRKVSFSLLISNQKYFMCQKKYLKTITAHRFNICDNCLLCFLLCFCLSRK